MKSRVILKDSLSNVTVYTTGELYVGDMQEILIDIHALHSAGGKATPHGYQGKECVFQWGICVSRLDAFDNLISLSTNDDIFYSYYAHDGEPVYPDGLSTVYLISDANSSFGDRIRIDLVNPQEIALSFTLSIIGKG